MNPALSIDWKANFILKRWDSHIVMDEFLLKKNLTHLTFYTVHWDSGLHEFSFLCAHKNNEIPAHLITPQLHPNVDFFDLLTEEEKNKLRTDPLHFYVFDFSWEGTPGTTWANWHLYLHYSAIKNNIPFCKIFYLTGNLEEKNTYNKWREKFDIKEEYNIICFIGWLPYVANTLKKVKWTIDDTVKFIKSNEIKYFLSLNRHFYNYRSVMNIRLKKSKFFDKVLISSLTADPFKQNIFMHYYKTYFELLKNVINYEDINEYFNSLPWMLDLETKDIDDLNKVGPPSEDLLKKTLFSLVGENFIVDDMLLFSEKAFKPMIYNHPVLIFGPKNRNKNLENIGFRTYKNYFDFELFDGIEDEVSRINATYEYLEKKLEFIDSLSLNGKIEWLLQDTYTLLYNKEEIINQSFNHKQRDMCSEKLLHIIDNFQPV